MSTADEVSEDRMIALRKRAEIDSKYLVVFDVVFDQTNPSEIGQSLNRYGDSFVESTQRVLFSSFRKNDQLSFAKYCKDWQAFLQNYQMHIIGRKAAGLKPVLRRKASVQSS